MEIKLLWDHHQLDGIDIPLYGYETHAFTFNVKKKNNYIKNIIRKLNKQTIPFVFEINIPEEKKELYPFFLLPNDRSSDIGIICKKEGINHYGYIQINKNEIEFYPIRTIK